MNNNPIVIPFASNGEQFETRIYTFADRIDVQTCKDGATLASFNARRSTMDDCESILGADLEEELVRLSQTPPPKPISTHIDRNRIIAHHLGLGEER